MNEFIEKLNYSCQSVFYRNLDEKLKSKLRLVLKLYIKIGFHIINIYYNL